MTTDILKRVFPPDAINFRIGNKGQNSSMCLAYLDARQVVERLEEYDPFYFGEHRNKSIRNLTALSAKGKHRIRVSVEYFLLMRPPGGFPENLTWEEKLHRYGRTDVGEAIGDEDDDKVEKTAYSDAIKRAAVNFGVGAYLYDMPKMFIKNDLVSQYGQIEPAGITRLRADYAKAIKLIEAKGMSETKSMPAPTPEPVAPSLVGTQADEQENALNRLGLKFGSDEEQIRTWAATAVQGGRFEEALHQVVSRADSELTLTEDPFQWVGGSPPTGERLWSLVKMIESSPPKTGVDAVKEVFGIK